MIIIAWIVLVMNVLVAVLNFINTFTDKTISGRFASFTSTLISLLTCVLALFIIR